MGEMEAERDERDSEREREPGSEGKRGGEAVRTCEIESEEGVKYLLNSAPPKCINKVLVLLDCLS